MNAPRAVRVLALTLTLGSSASAGEPVSPPEPTCARPCRIALAASASWVGAGASLVAARQARALYPTATDDDSATRLARLNHAGVVGGAVLGGASLGLMTLAVVTVRW